jgi:PHD/YefM family antitoxin component YafN of YafNO toxin-antitoxin module
VGIKTIPLVRFEKNLRATLDECADTGQPVVVELPGRRLVSIQSLEAGEDDSLTDDLLQSNPGFRALLAKSKAAPRIPFPPAEGPKKR